eukprot:303266-Amphidinium_carterae.2
MMTQSLISGRPMLAKRRSKLVPHPTISKTNHLPAETESCASSTGLAQVPLFVSGLVTAKESQYLQQCPDGEDNLPDHTSNTNGGLEANNILKTCQRTW